MPKKIKLKNKPTEPIRQTVNRQQHLFIGDTIKEISDSVPDHAEFSIETEYYGDQSYYFTWKELEDDNSWNRKLSLYNKRLEAYNKWYEENREDIGYTIELNKKDSLQNKIKERKNKKKALEKDLERIQKELEKINQTT